MNRICYFITRFGVEPITDSQRVIRNLTDPRDHFEFHTHLKLDGEIIEVHSRGGDISVSPAAETTYKEREYRAELLASLSECPAEIRELLPSVPA
jgi:hypothetical protein